MNYKAFILGAAVGFLFTLSPSCGGTTNECTTGCVAADGTCIEPAQTSAQQCGTDGQSCIACAANQACTAGQCVTVTGGTDGGVDGGPDAGDSGVEPVCGAANCTGCCSGDICLNGNSSSNCGTGGQACSSCMSPAICQTTAGTPGGQCVTPPMANYGAECMNNAECSSIGTTGICKQQTTSGSGTYEGGYCTKICGAQGTMCGSGSTCIQATGGGESDRICAKTCTPGSTTECRTPGYRCYDLGSGTGVCWIDPFPTFDAGTAAPPDLIGSMCMGDTDCQVGGSFAEGFCVQALDMNMNPTGWTDGYCSANCTDFQTRCGTTGICLTVNTMTGAAVCFDRCAAGGQGQSDCRVEYVCQQYVTTLADGGSQQSTDGYCFPDCRAAGGSCGTLTCDQATGYCG